MKSKVLMSELSDSGLILIGNQVREVSYNFPDLTEDHDAHMVDYEDYLYDMMEDSYEDWYYQGYDDYMRPEAAYTPTGVCYTSEDDLSGEDPDAIGRFAQHELLPQD